MSERFRERFTQVQMYHKKKKQEREEQERQNAEKDKERMIDTLWNLIKQANDKCETDVDIPAYVNFNYSYYKQLQPVFAEHGVCIIGYGDFPYRLEWRAHFTEKDE